MSRDSPKGIHERKAGTSIDLFHANKSSDQSPVSYVRESVLKALDSEQTAE